MLKGLGPATVKAIHDVVDKMFDRARARFLGPRVLGDKWIQIQIDPRLTLPGVYGAASLEERVRPDVERAHSLVNIADGYIKSVKERTKAQVVKSVESFLQQAQASGVKTDLVTVLGGELAQVFGKVTSDIQKIVDTELTTARNVGALEGIVKFNEARGISDPVVYFVVVRDQYLCSECRDLHLLPDQITPRVWYLSEVGHGYHKKGDPNPKIGGLHPHCRCSMVTLLPGYGFRNGAVSYISPDHDEVAEQRKP